MALQYSVAVRNARLDAIESTIGASAILKLRSGAQPASCAAADTGTVISTINLPADYLSAAAAGVKSKSGTWEDVTADAAGTLGHWRLYANDGTTCHAQGSITVTGGGGDMTVDNLTVAINQDIVINTFAITAGNA